ncbi:MAG: hypothetical protein F6J89_07050 [Symploca sp. SIO1C4]|uniref:Uncharacterized protein n=1 Tax=Symploca sp. SIO1C4 TaxID=2607765 RepID=A0A6B3N932_9CYAN|nr:hypothetical protein [Symploca sp. SIO1C4]
MKIDSSNISITLKQPCPNCKHKKGMLAETPSVHAAGLHCSNCGQWIKWVAKGENLACTIQIGKASAKTSTNTNTHPPLIPAKPSGRKRAIELLGSATTTQLKPKTKQELISLIGAYPANKEQAKAWRKAMTS